MKVRKKTNRPNRSEDIHLWEGLSEKRLYSVFCIEGDWYRIPMVADELPVLYPAWAFDIVDGSVESGWAFSVCEDGEVYLEFPPTNAPGFWEDVFDHDPKAIYILNKLLQKYYSN